MLHLLVNSLVLRSEFSFTYYILYDDKTCLLSTRIGYLVPNAEIFFLVFLGSIVALVVRSVGRKLLPRGGFECEIDYPRSDQPTPRVLTSPIDVFLPKRFGRVSRPA